VSEHLIIRGARVHNLKNLNLDLPRRALIVITGLSGAGKSSLAFDTIYAEGHRRYVESLSTYARQFLERVEKPDVDYVEGISPAIAIEQINPVKHTRSTVGTTTEIYDYLRLLFAKIGKTICPDCGTPVQPDTVQGTVDRLLRDYRGQRVLILYPLPITQATTVQGLMANLLAEGFVRVKVRGQVHTLAPGLTLDLAGESQIEVVVDRLSLEDSQRSRLAESIETAFIKGGGLAWVDILGETVWRLSEQFHCLPCGRIFERPTPLLFSFNNPRGACPACKGFGNILDYDLNLIIPDPHKSLAAGAIEPWTLPRYVRHYGDELRRLARREGIDLHLPFAQLPEAHRQKIVHGCIDFIGVLPFFRRLEAKKYKLYIRVFLSRYVTAVPCDACQGTRLRREALYVKVGGHSIAELSQMTVDHLERVIDEVPLTAFEQDIAQGLLTQLRARVHFLRQVGLNYLTIDRLTRTLSGGEAQRINLANQLGARLTDTLYILDEPTIGLHPRDTQRLVDILQQLTTQGNTVIVVEHDRDVIAAADHIVDLGPGAGERGGELIFSGPTEKMLQAAMSLTARYLRGEITIPPPAARRPTNGHCLRLYGAREHNLKGLDITIPLRTLTCITGVSGSGKSTLVHDTLYRALERIFHGTGGKIGKFERIVGVEHLRDVILLDQQPIGKSPRSNPVTYVDAFGPIRKLFAQTPRARIGGYQPGDFSFNVAGGRCEVCEGNGFLRIEMHFMADLFVTCEQCGGTRFKPDILEIRYNGVNIHEVLQMSVTQAVDFFPAAPQAQARLRLLAEVGLGYMRLGQPANTLSGGEAQRLKIAAELGKKDPRDVLYILDEPTTGLHFDDIRTLLRVLARLVDQGNTVVVVEHNLDVIKSSDHIIDLGPEGGAGGGEVVAVGPPEAIARNRRSHTGRYLRQVWRRGRA
jgi:excinuclease ABC subunit A